MATEANTTVNRREKLKQFNRYLTKFLARFALQPITKKGGLVRMCQSDEKYIYTYVLAGRIPVSEDVFVIARRSL